MMETLGAEEVRRVREGRLPIQIQRTSQNKSVTSVSDLHERMFKKSAYAQLVTVCNTEHQGSDLDALFGLLLNVCLRLEQEASDLLVTTLGSK